MNQKNEGVVGYARVSTEEQKEGLSLDNQESRIKAYAKSQGLKISTMFRDEGVSAKNINRPELEKLLQEITERNVDLVLVYRLDRLTRSMRDLYDLLALFKRNNVSFRSITEDFSTNTPVGKVVLGILGLFAEWERDVIGVRIKDALAHKKFKKEWIGHPPLGYRILTKTKSGQIIKSKTLIVVEKEAEIVKLIFHLRSKGKGLTQICRILKAKGINGRSWSPIGIWKILRNRTYAGNGTHKPIISKRLFDRVQALKECTK